MQGRAPGLPKTHIDVLDGIDSKAVKAGLADPVLINLRHARPHVVGFRFEIIQSAQLAKHDLRGVIEVLDVTVVVKQIRQRSIRGIQVEGWWIGLGAAVPEIVPGRRAEEVAVTRIRAVDEIAAMVDDDVVDDQQPARVGRLDHVLEVRQAAPMRVHMVKIPPGVAMKLAVSVEHDG